MVMGSLGYSSEMTLPQGREYIKKFYIKEIIEEVQPSTTRGKENLIDTKTQNVEEITPEVIQSRIDSLLQTFEGSLIYVGWENGKKCNYDTSVLTNEEKEKAIESGITILSEIALIEDTDLVCCETLAGYFYKKQDFKKAIYWAAHGAENGSSFCMVLLSDAHLKGIGVVQNFEEGFKWIYLAAAKGDKSSQKWVKKFGIKALTDPTLNDAKRRAHNWMLDHNDIFISIE